MNDEGMKQLLALMCLVDWLADDLHYKSKGIGFYEKHLLADRVRDLGSDDELKEAYWLGFKGIVPPADSEIAGMAIAAYSNMQTTAADMPVLDMLGMLKRAFELVIEAVEACKTEQGLPAGIHAILDGISQKALTFKFLVSSERAI